MTLMTTNTSPVAAPRRFSFGLMHRVLAWVERALETPAQRRLRDRVARLEALRSLSDADLAARGLTRDGLVIHVFAEKR